jgi:hypothetical protein
MVFKKIRTYNGIYEDCMIVSDFSSMETCITEDGLTNYGFEKASFEKRNRSIIS